MHRKLWEKNRNSMKKIILIALLGLMVLTSCVIAGQVNVGVYVGLPTQVIYEQPVYYPPPPPVIYYPQPVYYQQPSVVYYPPPRPYGGYYYGGTYFYGGYPRHRGYYRYR